jgi:dihydrofolate reductase
MRKIILQVAISLDGYIEGPQGEYDWCFMDQDYGMSEFLQRVDTVIMGRKTYELMKSFPVTPGDSFSLALSRMDQYVFSNTMISLPDDSPYKLIHTDHMDWLKEYKFITGKDIWLFGGANFTSSLFHHHLVDEIILAVHPVLLGSGKSFAQGLSERVKLEFIDSTSFDTGLVLMKYRVK